MAYTRLELAERAGTPPAFIERLCELEILTAGAECVACLTGAGAARMRGTARIRARGWVAQW